MLIDPLGRMVPLRATPQRIVSLVPSLSEYLVQIGCGARLVGVTEYCVEPAAALAALPRVRGTKNPNREFIQQLRPDLVLAAREENLERDVRALEQAGIPVYVTDICTVAGALQQLSELARLLEAEMAAAPILQRLQTALAQAEAQLQHAGSRRLRVLALIWRDPWMAIGRDTYADDLLRLAGMENIGLRLPGRYPRAALEQMLQYNPELILLPDEPYRFSSADLPAFAEFGDVAAVLQRKLILCDGKLLTWYGQRSAEALEWLLARSW